MELKDWKKHFDSIIRIKLNKLPVPMHDEEVQLFSGNIPVAMARYIDEEDICESTVLIAADEGSTYTEIATALDDDLGELVEQFEESAKENEEDCNYEVTWFSVGMKTYGDATDLDEETIPAACAYILSAIVKGINVDKVPYFDYDWELGRTLVIMEHYFDDYIMYSYFNEDGELCYQEDMSFGEWEEWAETFSASSDDDPNELGDAAWRQAVSEVEDELSSEDMTSASIIDATLHVEQTLCGDSEISTDITGLQLLSYHNLIFDEEGYFEDIDIEFKVDSADNIKTFINSEKESFEECAEEHPAVLWALQSNNMQNVNFSPTEINTLIGYVTAEIYGADKSAITVPHLAQRTIVRLNTGCMVSPLFHVWPENKKYEDAYRTDYIFAVNPDGTLTYITADGDKIVHHFDK